jgi:hypothetical protein
LDRIVQHEPDIKLDPFLFWVGNIDESTSIELPIIITAEELPRPTSQKIEVVINLKK